MIPMGGDDGGGAGYSGGEVAVEAEVELDDSGGGSSGDGYSGGDGCSGGEVAVTGVDLDDSGGTDKHAEEIANTSEEIAMEDDALKIALEIVLKTAEKRAKTAEKRADHAEKRADHAEIMAKTAKRDAKLMEAEIACQKFATAVGGKSREHDMVMLGEVRRAKFAELDAEMDAARARVDAAADAGGGALRLCPAPGVVCSCAWRRR